MAESPQERSPGVFSRIGSWLSWGWGGPVLSGDEPTSQTQREEASDEDHRETSRPTAGAHERDSPAVGETAQAEKSPSPSRNAKHLRGGREGEDGTWETQVCFVNRRRSTPDFSDQDKTEQMGRRRSGRRRRSSHGDVGGSEPRSPTSPATTSLATSPQKACADSAFEEAETSVQECSGAEAPNSGSREDEVRAEWLEADPSRDAADSQSSANPALADSDMDEEPVVRMTESAESKRRSIKVSHSEKIFAKRVVVASEDPDEDQHLRLKSTSDPKWSRSDDRARCPEDKVDGTKVKASHQKGRIADKISLFERGPTKTVPSSRNLRHLDISPARNVAVRLTEHGGPRSGSAPPKRTVKERAMNFNAGGEKLTLSSGQASSEGHSKTTGRTEASCSGEVKPKPTDQTDSKSHNATQSKPALSESTSDSNIGDRDLDQVSCPVTDETPQVKSPNRTSSRSKKRRGKDTTQPLSPTSKNKQDMGQGNTDPNIPPKHLLDAGDDVNTTDQCLKSTSGEELMQSMKTTSNTDSKRLQKTPHMDTKGLKEMNRDDFEGSASKALNSSNEVTIERTGIGENPHKKQPVQEGERGEKNRDTIVNTLFGESGKLDPSVTKDEKPPSPEEDVRAANSKDSANSSAASSRKDAMWNRGSETDMLVLPDKDTITCVHEATNTPGNDPKSERPSKPNYKSKENDASPSRTPKPALVKTQNYKMDAIISPQIPPRDGGDPKRGGQSESREEQKVRTASSKRDLQQPEQKTSIENTSKVNGDFNSVEKGDQLSVCLEQSGEQTLSSSHENTQIPPGNDNLSLRSEKKKPITANEASTSQSDQASEKITAKPASTNETASTVPASTNEKATPLPASANEKATPLPASANEKATPLPASANEKATPLPASANEKATPLPASANEKATPPPSSANEKATPPPASANEKATPPPASANEKATPLPASASETATPPPASANEKATPLPASANEKTTPLPASAKEKTTPPPASTNETNSTLPASTNEKATPLANEKATTLPASANEKATPLPASAKEKATPPPASANETATPPPASANEKATPLPASAKEKAMPPPASANEKATPLPASANEKATPPPASTIETNSTLPASTNEKATPLPASANEKTTPLPASANEKATPPTASTNKKATPLPASANEKATPPTASTNKKATPLPASANKKATALPASANEKTTPLPASANEKATPPTTSTNEKATPLPASTNEKATPLANEEATPLANEKATPLPASANEKATPLPASTNEKATPLPASANEKTTPPTESTNKETTPPPASTNETTSTLPASTNEKATPLPASASEKATPLPASANEKATTLPASANEKATPLPASANEKTTPPPASTNETTSTLPASTNKKTTPAKPTKENVPPPATTDSTASNDKTTKHERTSPLPASSSFPLTSTNGENITPIPSSIEKSVLPPASIKEKILPPHASTKEKISPSPSGKSTDPATRKKEFTPKPFFLPQIPSAPGSSSQNRDSPSSWLDVERPIRKKQLISEPKPKLSTSVGKTNRDTSGEFDPDDFIANVKRLAMPFNLPQRKHNKHRLQAPPSVLPAIREDRYEKPFDPDEFQHGLRKRKGFILDLPSSSISKSPDKEDKKDTKPKSARPERKSILTRSMIFQRSRKESKQEEGEKEKTVSDESTTEPLNTRSRLERCSIVSILRSSSKGRRMEFLSPTECPSDGLLSPTDAPGSTPPPQSQLAPAAESPEPVLVEEVLAKSDCRFTPYGKPSKDVGPTPTTDPKTTSRNQTVMVTDTNAPPSDTQTTPQVLKPNKEDGPTQAPDLKTTSPDPRITDSPPTPSHTQSGSQVVLKHTKNDGPTMKPDLKADPTVTMLTDTNALLHPSGTQTTPQVVLKPTKEDGATPTTEPKTTSRDQTVTVTDTNAPPSDTQTTPQVLNPTKEDGPTPTIDPKTTSPDPRVTDSPPTPSHTQSDSQVVLKHTKNDGPTMKPDLKADPTVTMLTDTNTRLHPSGTQTTPQVVLKPTKEDGATPTTEPKTTSRDQTVTVTDTNAPPSDTQTTPQVLKPTKEDGPTQAPDLKTTSPDPRVTDSPPTPSHTQSDSQAVLKHTNNDGPTMKPDLKTDPTVTMLTDTNTLLHPGGTQTTPQVVLKPTKDDGPTPTTSADPPVSVLTDSKAPPLPGGIQTGSDVVLQPDGPTLMPDLKTTPVDPIATMITAAPPLPSFEDIKLPSLLEKFLQKTPETSQSSNKIDPLVARESASIPGHVDLNTAVDVADRKTQEVTIPPAPQLPASQILPANPQRELPNIPTARGIHRRPAKIVIFEHHEFKGQSFEFYRDQPDATQMQLSSVISVKVVRGCWILYEKPGFEGRCIALEEEGVTELPNQWAEEGGETSTPLVIGSIRLAIRDYTPPRIELFTEPAGRGRSSEYVDITEEVGSFSLPQNTGSIKVHSGLWLVYSDPGFQGLLAVMEAGEYPFPEDWGFAEPIVGSLRPLRMGLPKVENPTAVKAVLYERAGLQGRGVEVQGDVFSFRTDPDHHGLTCVESLKILGGLWVGYEREGFDGQQFLLEEGEYLDWRDWGGTGQKLLSLRPVLMDFSSPHMKMFSELDFSERGVNIDLQEPLENLCDTHFGSHTGSIEVLAGVWVVFEEPGFSGRQFVLEKGLYGSPEDWGASDGRIASAIPVTLENLEHSCHFQINLFSEPGLDGTSVVLQDSLPTMPEGFSVRSCRVFAGSWLAFSSECFSGRQCVLEEGVYPDLRTMGFTQPNTSLLSIHPTGHEFSLPSVVLFERSGLKGRRTLLKSSSVNLQLTDSCTRVSSILVEGGMWVLYEAINFRGSQFLLKPGAVPDWPKLSSWRRIGSLRPLIQKQPLFRLRSEEAGLMMGVTGSLEDLKLMRVQVSEETGGADQIWAYQDGRLQCKWLPDCCVDVGSGVLMPGSRAVLSSEPGKPHQLWNISSDGIIRSNAAPHLVLEVKGGQQFDKSQIILNEFQPNKMNQRWSLEIL